MRFVILGGGNAAHCLAGMIRESGVKVDALHIYSRLAEEEKAWRESCDVVMKKPDGSEISFRVDGAVPIARPRELLNAADMLICCVPGFAVEPVLEAVGEHLRDGSVLVGMPGTGGFARCAKAILPEDSQVMICGTQQLPIQCRALEYARSCHLLGTKHGIQLATFDRDAARLADVGRTLEALFSPVHFHPVEGGMSVLDLYPANQCIHIPRLHELWQGAPYDENPLFYEGYGEKAVEAMDVLCDELGAVANAAGTPIPHMHEAMLRYYRHSVADPSTLHSTITSNAGYKGLRSPMILNSKNRWVLDTSSRYFVEDIPYSLLIAKAISQSVNVDTPTIDMYLTWAQDLLGKQYLNGKRIDETSPDVMASLVRYYL